jgi:RND family efflux transporter MFP subunit
MMLSVGGCKQEQPERVVRPVRSQTVKSAQRTRQRVFSGSTQAGSESKLSFKVAGTVLHVSVDVGEEVAKDQLIAELDARDYELSAERVDAALEQAKAQARNAKANYERIGQLYENRNASRNDLDMARASFESTQALVASTEKEQELAQRQLSYTRLLAPTSGTIAVVSVEENENVNAGQTVAILTSGTHPEVKIAVPGSFIAQISRGDQAKVRFAAWPGQEFTGAVTEVGVTATATATTFPVTVRLAQARPDILSGLVAEVEFTFTQGDDAEVFVVPFTAVGEDRSGRFVFVLGNIKDGRATARRREVTVGELTSDGLEVVSGLSNGERIATAGVSRIIEGQRVRLFGEGK